VINDRAGAEAPQQQAQQQAQPNGELSDNGEENTAPQPQPDDAGAKSLGAHSIVRAPHALTAHRIHAGHAVCSCAWCSAASASQQVHMRKDFRTQNRTPKAASSFIKSGVRPDVAVLAGWAAGAAVPGGRAQPGRDRGGDTGAAAASAGAGDAASEGMTDAELALMLQREEQQAHLLELAGYGDGDYCSTLLLCMFTQLHVVVHHWLCLHPQNSLPGESPTWTFDTACIS
jgi:hypothetical protein